MGEQWQQRLLTSVDEEIFFIPLITPSYFETAACRTELEAFLQREQKLLYEELILPVYWIEIDQPSDDFAAVIMSRKYVDGREPRLRANNDPTTDEDVAKISTTDSPAERVQ